MEHIPVLLGEVIGGLGLRPGAACIDCTLGGGGYAAALLAATAPDGRLLGLDCDAEAVQRAAERLASFGERAILCRSSFREVAAVAHRFDFPPAQAIVMDLGVSTYQLSDPARGLSFMLDGPLDMRMDSGSALTAEEIVNTWPPEKLADVIYRYGEEPRSHRVARAIVDARPLHSTIALAEVISRALGGRAGRRTHPATRVFQALRIAVNDELGALEAGLQQAVALLEPGGRLAVVTFHSLEDRPVKRFMQREARDCICDLDPGLTRRLGTAACQCGHRATLRIVTGKAIQPGDAEVSLNPRSRSAKLRIAERLAPVPSGQA